MRALRPVFAGALLAGAGTLLGCAPGVSTTRIGPEPDAASRARAARARLEDARQFESQGRSDAAEHALREAVAFAPEDAVALRALARYLTQSGRTEEAAALRARADAVDPPPPPLPETPYPADVRGLVVVIVPLGHADGAPAALAADALRERVGARLPAATVASLDPATADDARQWLEAQRAQRVLSLVLERADCTSSLKDGAYARVWLRAATATPGGIAAPAIGVRELDRDPEAGTECILRPVARAFERVLADPGVAPALAAPATRGEWTTTALRSVFPGLDVRLEAALERGRGELARGRLDAAIRSFESALAIDPDDADARAYLDEARSARALAHDLHGGAAIDPAATEDVLLSPAEREAAERELAEERQRRDQLLAAVDVLSGGEPDPAQLRDALRRVELPADESVALRLARARSPGPVERRALLAPDGRALASWYFDAASGAPVLREEDRNHDGRAETWALWQDGRRSEVLEDREGTGRPDTRVALAPDGSVLRIEMTSGAEDVPTRIFEYGDGHLVRESRDTNGDGRLDCFERFDAGGVVAERAQDLDGDGIVDVRSFYEGGRLVRREVLDPSRLQELM